MGWKLSSSCHAGSSFSEGAASHQPHPPTFTHTHTCPPLPSRRAHLKEDRHKVQVEEERAHGTQTLTGTCEEEWREE